MVRAKPSPLAVAPLEFRWLLLPNGEVGREQQLSPFDCKYEVECVPFAALHTATYWLGVDAMACSISKDLREVGCNPSSLQRGRFELSSTVASLSAGNNANPPA